MRACMDARRMTMRHGDTYPRISRGLKRTRGRGDATKPIFLKLSFSNVLPGLLPPVSNERNTRRSKTTPQSPANRDKVAALCGQKLVRILILSLLGCHPMTMYVNFCAHLARHRFQSLSTLRGDESGHFFLGATDREHEENNLSQRQPGILNPKHHCIKLMKGQLCKRNPVTELFEKLGNTPT